MVVRFYTFFLPLSTVPYMSFETRHNTLGSPILRNKSKNILQKPFFASKVKIGNNIHPINTFSKKYIRIHPPFRVIRNAIYSHADSNGSDFYLSLQRIGS